MDKPMPKLTWKTKGPSLAEMLWRKTNKKQWGVVNLKGAVNLVYISILMFLILAWDTELKTPPLWSLTMEPTIVQFSVKKQSMSQQHNG